MTFDLIACRFTFAALDSIFFPRGKAGNTLRGAFGLTFRRLACRPGCEDAAVCEYRSTCAYARTFEPDSAGFGPSGFSDLPRPFVFRAARLEDRTIRPGELFHFDLHLFRTVDPDLDYFVRAFSDLVRDGLGPRRGRAELQSVAMLDKDHSPQSAPLLYSAGKLAPSDTRTQLHVSLEPSKKPIEKVRIDFLTPTELKGELEDPTRIDFGVLFARARDRVSALRALYGAGPLPLDFRAVGELARQVRLARCELRRFDVERRSSRTGQTHPIGGLIGEAEYVGDLSQFVPFLQAAEWTGVGRQTVWGKGEIRCHILG